MQVLTVRIERNGTLVRAFQGPRRPAGPWPLQAYTIHGLTVLAKYHSPSSSCLNFCDYC